MSLSAVKNSAQILLALTYFIVSSAFAQQPLEIFGAQLQGVDRDHFRTVLKKNGMRATREDNRYWVDSYDSSRVLDGAKEFMVGYVSATNTFAYGRYTFPAFMDTGMVIKVQDMVAAKYGPPSSRTGRANLGNYSAVWNFPDGMNIEVSRGWPDTTTYLTFEDERAHQAMQAEIDETTKAKTQERAREQGGAF